MYTQTKPARRLGGDITQATLQQTLTNAGIDKQIANLSYAEKRLVIVASLLQQVKEANNDWGRTINCGIILKSIMKNFVNLCKKGVNIFKNIFANDKALQTI